MHSKLSDYILIVAATYILYLGINQQLNLYIHPRFIVFTVTMAAIALTLLLLKQLFRQEDHHGSLKSLSLAPIVIILLAGLSLPARTLTSATVSQRATDAGSLVGTSSSRPLSSLFASSSKGLKIADWSRLLASNTDPSYYNDRPARISGFVYDADLGNDTVWLARFILTCCAVDAQPVGVPVQLQNWPTEYERDEWVAVEGEFQSVQTAQGEQLVLVPDKVKKIEQPANPYAN